MRAALSLTPIETKGRRRKFLGGHGMGRAATVCGSSEWFWTREIDFGYAANTVVEQKLESLALGFC